jgi:oxygen-independent coproporphyrinogen-3 oxidase
MGASAISSVGLTYAQNTKDIDEYINHSGRSPWVKGLVMNREDEIRRDIILDLFCNFYLDITTIEERFDIEFQDHFAEELNSLKPMQSDGLIVVSENSLSVTDLGRFFIRNICMIFDQYLTGENPEARYSRTI